EVLFTILVTAVEPGGGVPTGTVTLESGAGTLGTADLDENGMATVAATFFEAGAHNVFATYSGDDHFQASGSATLVQPVARSGTDTVLDVSATDVVFSEQVVLTATVFAREPGGGVPTGAVTFRAGGVVLGRADLDEDGVAVLVADNIPAGTQALT